MRVEVLGNGCSKCKEMVANVRQALKEIRVDADLMTLNDPEKMAELGILTLPALVVDGELKSSGRILSVHEVKEFLE